MEFKIIKAVTTDSATIADVIQEVYRTLEQKDWYVADNAEYTYRMLSSGKGMGYLALNAETDEIAGVFMVTFPGNSKGNLGNDIGLSKEQLPLCAHMDSAAVLPKYRGNHLQCRLMQTAEKELAALGYRYLLCTVHPDNRFSKGNALRQGYQVMKTTEKYGGYLRDILMKEI